MAPARCLRFIVESFLLHLPEFLVGACEALSSCSMACISICMAVRCLLFSRARCMRLKIRQLHPCQLKWSTNLGFDRQVGGGASCTVSCIAHANGGGSWHRHLSCLMDVLDRVGVLLSLLSCREPVHTLNLFIPRLRQVAMALVVLILATALVATFLAQCRGCCLDILSSCLINASSSVISAARNPAVALAATAVSAACFASIQLCPGCLFAFAFVCCCT